MTVPTDQPTTAACTVVRYQHGPIEALDVQPVGAFSRELLTGAHGERLIYDGQTIILDVDNGRWVWVVTGQSADGSVVYGRWPD